jgi:hypothetical protein
VVQAFGRGPGRQSDAALVHWASEERLGRSRSGARLTERQRLRQAARSALECKRWAAGGQVARATLEHVCERGSDAARPGEHGFGSRKRKSSYTACRTTMCREVTRDAREVAMRRLQADLPREQ